MTAQTMQRTLERIEALGYDVVCTGHGRMLALKWRGWAQGNPKPTIEALEAEALRLAKERTHE